MVQYSLDICKDKQELVADMKTAQEHICRLRDLKTSGSTLDAIRSQQEALQENVFKVFIKWKEEWRFVLTFVPELVSTALATLEATSEDVPPNDVLFEMVLDFLRNLTLCISPKRMTRYWPTEVSWLVKLVRWLEHSLAAQSNWSTLYVLILWLSSAVRTPFDLSRFDVNTAKDEHSLAHRIDDIIRGTAQNYALLPVVHLLAGSFYSRPDIVRSSSRLERFIGSLLIQLKSDRSSVNDKVCCLRSLATLLKTIDRSTMSVHVDQIVEPVMTLVDSPHELLAKLSIKILGRSALTRIRPRLLKWRYNCGKRIIDGTAKSPPAADSTNGKPPPLLKEIKSSSAEDDLLPDLDDKDEEEDFDFDELPPYFEALIQLLLSSLNHPASVVRLSVAKYLASICSRLPYQFSADILGHVVEHLASPTMDDLAWHGACLALAEFVRRGYVRVDFMVRVVEVVEKALFYEHLKGSFSLGSHVRDAAAYICWSMARAYDGRQIGPFVDRLAPALINVVCFDRALNCRRAASAVIQELAGRTQRFPHWLDVIGRTEFAELSLLEHTFLQMGVHFAATYEVFREAIIQHLLTDKSTHWDPAIRRLAAQTLGRISAVVPFARRDQALKILLERALSADLNGRHGAILSLAQIIGNDRSLNVEAAGSSELQAKLWRTVKGLFEELKCRNLYVGMGGEFMKEGSLAMVEQYCARGWTVPKEEGLRSSWQEVVLSGVNTESDVVQEVTVSAVVAFSSALLKESANVHHEPFLKALLGVFSRHEAAFAVSTVARSTVLMADEVLRPLANDFVREALAFLRATFGSELRRSETVADVVGAVVRLVGRFMGEVEEPLRQEVADWLIRALEDHTITKQGNVGLLVRVAAMEALKTPDCPFLNSMAPEQLLQIVRLVAGEAVFKRNGSYPLAVKKLAALGKWIGEGKQKSATGLLPEETVRLMVQLETDQGVISEELEQYAVLVKLFDCHQLTPWLWPGLICVIADPLLEPFTKVFVAFLRASPQREQVLETFLKVATDKAKDGRLALLLLVSANALLTSVPTSGEWQEKVATVCWSVVKGSANPKKYLLAADVFCTLVPLGSANLGNAMRFLYVLLGHQLPRVRSYTATEMYTALMAVDDLEGDGGDGSQLMEAVELLQTTDWLVAAEARASRERIRAIVKQALSASE